MQVHPRHQFRLWDWGVVFPIPMCVATTKWQSSSKNIMSRGMSSNLLERWERTSRKFGESSCYVVAASNNILLSKCGHFLHTKKNKNKNKISMQIMKSVSCWKISLLFVSFWNQCNAESYMKSKSSQEIMPFMIISSVRNNYWSISLHTWYCSLCTDIVLSSWFLLGWLSRIALRVVQKDTAMLPQVTIIVLTFPLDVLLIAPSFGAGVLMLTHFHLMS